MINQQGKITNLILIIAISLLAAKIFLPKFPQNSSQIAANTPIKLTSSTYDAAQSYCQGGIYGTPPNGSETFQAHPFQEEDDNDITILYREPLVTYKLVRSAIPRYARLSHTTQYIPSKDKDIIRGKKSKIYFSNGDYSVPQKGKVRFAEYGLAYIIPLNNEGGIDVVQLSDVESKYNHYILVDVYQRADKPDFPLEVFDCSKNQKGQDLAQVAAKKDKKSEVIVSPKTINQVGAEIIFPEEQNKSEDKQELQLEYFVLGSPKKFESSSSEGIWVPGCKPAIYLYPKEKTLVNVKVKTKGFLTLTIPPYPENGWNVHAYPDGKIYDMRYTIYDQPYPYLYYESKVPDKLIQKPKEGFVVEYSQLKNLYTHLLPQLGLDQNQTKDFIDYWTKALPDSLYYFVGIMDQAQIDQIEPLEITPKPDYINRVRIYFEALEKRPLFENIPVLNPKPYPLNPSFKVVEWGGMVKTDPLHPFTCSQ